MDLFFLISGFITAYVFIPSDRPLTAGTYGRFLVGRLIRLYPSYFAALLFLVALVVLTSLFHWQLPGSYPWKMLPFRVLLLQAFPFCQWGTWTWNHATWFLSALAFGYVFVFPFCWRLVQSLRNPGSAFAWVFAPIAIWVVVWHIPGLADYHMLMRVSAGFLAGSALFALFSQDHPFFKFTQRHFDKTTVAIALAALVLSLGPPRLVRGGINGLLELALPLMLAGVTAEKSWTARFLATRPLQWLGSMAYALFLTHFLALNFMEMVAPSQRYASAPFYVRGLMASAYLATTILFAAALRYWVEVPCITALKRRFGQRRNESQARLSAASPMTVPLRNSP
jgi:peptidoglycan/LPS O-acetylase OafA/YrhL